MSKDNSEINEKIEAALGSKTLDDPDGILEQYDIFQLGASLTEAVKKEFQDFFDEQKTAEPQFQNDSKSQKPKGRVLKVEAETLEELYNILWTVYAKDSTPVVHLDFTQATVIDDQALQVIRGFEKLETLNLKGCTNITYDGLLDLRESRNLPNLKQMNVTGCNVGQNLDGLGTLKISISNPNNLEPARNLEELLPNTIVSNATAQKIATPSNLALLNC